MNGVFVAIDPGISGAIAVVQRKEVLEVHDLPVHSITKTTKTKSGKFKQSSELDIEGFFLLFKGILRAWRPALVVIEKVHSMPGQGVASMFSFGRNFGQLEGVIRTTGGTPIRYITPQEWKKHHKLIKKGKDASIILCKLLYPVLRDSFRTPNGTKDTKDGRADAILMGEYARVMSFKEGW